MLRLMCALWVVASVGLPLLTCWLKQVREAELVRMLWVEFGSTYACCTVLCALGWWHQCKHGCLLLAMAVARVLS
jgi:hypothetical protein